MYDPETTIFAWATAHQHAARAVLRISGPETFSLCKKFFCCDSGDMEFSRLAHRVIAGKVLLSENLFLRCQLWIFPSPKSYTGQDSVELHTPSSPALMRIIDQRLLCFGLIPAQSGEFSARAFFNGKMDLTQVQGVNELINAENDAQIESAISMLEGHYHQHLTRGYESLNNLAGLIEASIDFSEEDIEFISCKSILEELNQLIELFEQILRDALDSKQIMTLPRVFLVGLTNSGKSTLVNRLSGLHRAIISQFSGTTRDILSVVWKHDRQELMLCDTPGLLAKSSDDSITRSAVERCLKYLPLADMILFVIDPTRSIAEQVQLFSSLNVNKDKIVYVINKSDLGQRGEPLDVDKPSFQVSGLLGNGLAELTNFVFERMKARSVTIVTGQIALDVRSRNIITETVGILRSAADETKNIMHYSTSPGIEVIASIIQSAIRSLGTLLGKDVTENVLETIFSRFCIGK